MLKQHSRDNPELAVTGMPVLEWPPRKVGCIFLFSFTMFLINIHPVAHYIIFFILEGHFSVL